MYKVNIEDLIDLEFKKNKKSFYHFTGKEKIDSIREKGLLANPPCKDNEVKGDDEHPSVYFSEGIYGVLKAVDSWIRWEYDWIVDRVNEKISYNISYGYEAINENIKNLTYKTLYENFNNRIYLSLNLIEENNNEKGDFNRANIDFKKIEAMGRDNKFYNDFKWKYGDYSDITCVTMEDWNMSAHEGHDIVADKIGIICDSEGKVNSLDIIIQIYEKIEKNSINFQINDLEDFMQYVVKQNNIESEKNSISINTSKFNLMKEIDMMCKKYFLNM